MGNGRLSQNYYYDVAGNLTARKDNNLNVLENFSYDNLNRLTGESVGIHYWHKDHLGSIAAVTDENGKLVERLAYDPFGRRRQPSGAMDAAGNIRPVSTNRGFTGHEHLDDMASFIHMNGRIFDPMLGRFLSPDKFVQGPNNLQSHNRYSYLFNSPLNGTDPSGFLGETNIPLDLGGIFGNLYGGPQMGSAFGTIVSGIATGINNLGPITVYDNNGNPYASNAGPGLGNLVLPNVNPDIGANISNLLSNIPSNIGAGVNSPVFIEHLDWSMLTGGSAYNGAPPGVSTLTTLKNVIVPSLDIWDTGSLDTGGDASNALLGRPVVNLGFDNRQRAMARGATVGAALGGAAGGLFGSGCAVASGGLCGFGIPALISAGASGGALLGATIAGLAVDVGQLMMSGADKPSLLDPAGEAHVLDGDASGGGHRPGTGNPGKSEFPSGWSDGKITGEISDVATDPGSIRSPGRGGRTVVNGTRDGINIDVILDPNGRIVTGYPTNVPRNPR